MNIGEKLYELRKGRNLTQDEVAEKLNVTRQTISKWETNQSVPDFDKIVPLCELYGISPNELLIGEKQKQETVDDEKSNQFNYEEAKKHLFTRRKENYENMTKNQIKQKSAEIVSSSILIFFFGIAFAGIGTTVMMWNPIIVGCIFLMIIGFGVTRIIKHYMSVPKFERTKEEEKKDKIEKQISDIIIGIGVAIYFIVSFITLAWHITWIIFIISGMIVQIVKIIFMLKEDDNDEE